MKTNEAKIKALELAGVVDIDAETIERAEAHDWLTINRGRDGNEYAWYLDPDGKEACVRIDTGKQVDEQTIEALFC